MEATAKPRKSRNKSVKTTSHTKVVGKEEKATENSDNQNKKDILHSNEDVERKSSTSEHFNDEDKSYVQPETEVQQTLYSTIPNEFSKNDDNTNEVSVYEPVQPQFLTDEDCIPYAPPEDLESEMPLTMDTVLLPIQEDDWDLSASEQNTDSLYPSLERNTTKPNSAMKPFTPSERSLFYQNPLLEQDSMHTDQFLTDAAVSHSYFKTLLQNYYQARLKLIKSRKEFEAQNENVGDSFKSVFTEKQGMISAEAYCEDHRKVTTSHTYKICAFDEEECSKLTSALRKGRRLASDNVLTCSYVSSVCRLRCEQFLYDVTEKYKYHRNNLKVNTETQGPTSQLSILLQLVDESLADLKHICNTLFSYKRHRKSCDESDDRFWKDVERWLSLVILNMIQSVECETESGRHFREELFVLNHIIRCPPGVHTWINGLAQVSGPLPLTSKDKTSIDHSIYLLHLILHPSKGREEFLSQFLVENFSSHLPNQQKNEWTMIDEDGDEIDAASGFTQEMINIMPLENDLITLFQQVPFRDLLVHILGLSLSTDDTYEYSGDSAASDDIMATLVVSEQLCDILGAGLQTLGRPKYKQLVRRVAQAMRNIVLLMSEHLEQYKFKIDESSTQIYSVERLQLEFDEFCKRCISKLLSVARLGIYQFIADLPFGSMSLRAVETLYVLMNVPASAREEVEKLVRTDYSQQEWIDFVQDSDTKLAFEDQLSAMPANEIVYLLTAFANLAQTRPSEEQHLINNIVIDIYKISFIYKSTRDICCKTGRELLSSITFHHPFTISTLLHFINQNLNEIQTMAIYSMNDVSFSLWKPSIEDLEVLRSFLTNFSPDSLESRFAQYFIKGLNFNMDASGKEYFLPNRTHCHVGLLIIEAHVHLLQDKQQANLMMKSFDQVSKVASVARLAPSVEHKFTKWCWEILLLLKVHRQQYSIQVEEPIIRDLHNHVPFVPLLDAVKDLHPMANYLAIMMTSIGHNMEKFLSEGIELLLSLAKLGYAKAVVKCLFCVVPIFCKAKMNLAENDRFKEVLLALIHSADYGIFSDMANRFIVESQPKEAPTDFIISVIHSHLTSGTDTEEQSFLALYWLEMILTLKDWHKDQHLTRIVDFLFQHASVIGERCNLGFRTLLYQQLVEMMLHKPSQTQNTHHSSVMSSLISLVSGNNSNMMPCLVNSFEHGKNIYFGFAALEAETRYEDDSGFWSAVISMLQVDAKINIDTCLKKVANKLKLPYLPQSANLCLYRWSELALNTPYDHPLLQIIWLRFFLRFIFLPPDGANSVGYRFFSAVSMLPTFNKIRSHLQIISEYHVGIISGRVYDTGMKPHHERCVQLYQSFKLWLEEPKLHEVNLYLPSLPPQYNPDLLASVRTKQPNLFDDFVKLTEIHKKLLVNTSILEKNEIRKIDKNVITNKSISAVSTERLRKMTQLLNQFEAPKPLPYVVAYGSLSSPVALGDVSQIWRYETVLQVIDLDLKIISSFAEDVLKLQARLGQIDTDYLNTLPNLYFMKDAELWQKVECQSGFAVTHKCLGPAQIRLRFKEKAVRGSVSQDLKANRNLYQEALNKFLCEDTSNDLCFAALHLESLIHALESNLNKPNFTDEVKTSIQESGVKLFYLLANMYSKERKACNPTRHLLSTCVELLGQIFISQSSEHAGNILDEVLNNPASSALLSPHFFPGFVNNVPQQTQTSEYLKMYQRVMKVVSTNTDEDGDVLFVLLTKFEVSSWMNEMHPSTAERLKLLQHIFVGLISCNVKMKQLDMADQNAEHGRHGEDDVMYKAVAHRPCYSAMHEIYLSHFTAVLKHQFPEALLQAVKNLLEACRSHHLKPEVWDIVLSTSFNKKLNPTGDIKHDHILSCDMYSTNVDWNTLLHLFNMCKQYFQPSVVKPNQKTRCSDLYTKWSQYVPHLSKMFGCMSHTLLVFEHEGKIPQQYSDENLSRDGQWCLLVDVISLYQAWMDPSACRSTGDVKWPWNSNESELAEWMANSLHAVMMEFCKGHSDVVSSQLQCIWSHYSWIVLQCNPDLPTYVLSTYHKMLHDLPWDSFIPSPGLLESMVQICDCSSNAIKDFLCLVVTKIPWKKLLDMCKPDNQASSPENSVASHVLGLLLHIIFVLGSDESRFIKLQSAYNNVEQFPVDIIGTDQIEYLANLVSDHYQWTSFILSEPIKSKKIDMRFQVFRMLKIICRLPLVSGERIKGTDGVAMSHFTSKDLLKQQSYIRCVGRLLQKSKPEEFGFVQELTCRLIRCIEIIMESVEMTASFDLDSHNLTSLVFTVFDYLNIFPPTFQQPTLTGFINVLQRFPFCKDFLRKSNNESVHDCAQCQDCAYSRSRAMSKNTLLACLGASCNIAMFPEYSCQLMELCIESYICSVAVENLGTDSSSTWSSDCWKNILKIFEKSAHKEELLIQSISHSTLLTLHACTMNIDVMPDFYTNKAHLPENVLSTLSTRKLLDHTTKLLEWLPQCAAVGSNEGKLLLLIDQFLYTCSMMWQYALNNTTKDFSVDTVAVQATKLLQILEYFSLDKVKSGFLGSIGIGKQSPFSLNFRLLARCLTIFLHQWHARVYPTSANYVDVAQKTFEAVKNLPVTNKQYSSLSSTIDEVCDFMTNQSQGDLEEYRKVVSIFAKKHYFNFLYLHHLAQK